MIVELDNSGTTENPLIRITIATFLSRLAFVTMKDDALIISFVTHQFELRQQNGKQQVVYIAPIS